MKLKVWSETLLNVYSCLEKIANEIDKAVMHSALCSGCYNGVGKTYRETQKIIEFTERKITLINLKVLIENCLDNLDLTSCKILTLKYVDKVSNEHIMKAINVKKRTYYRKIGNAIKSFANSLSCRGFNSNKIYELVKNEEWIVDIFKTYLEKEISKSTELNISDFSIYALALKNFKKTKDVRVFA